MEETPLFVMLAISKYFGESEFETLQLNLVFGAVNIKVNYAYLLILKARKLAFSEQTLTFLQKYWKFN